ncbi:MAG TPA: FAD-dependent monooxygenase [Prolixibacteraceae bacterium]|nr:FAD-dependent monooxygenase [Prolixibacteraceae bacterium]
MQTQSRDKNIDVLIVGAGPAGLMMACQLALHNISFRIIDKKYHRTNYSGALIVQARSLEIFQQMGIAQIAVQSGVIANEIKLIFNGKKSFAIPVKEIGRGLTLFPYMLLLEQSKTEQILTDFLNNIGYSIERVTELDRFTQDDLGVTSILKLPAGNEEIITTKYLIAADGARSTIRKQLQIPFVGKTYPISLFVSDCKAIGELSSNQLCFSFSDKTTAGFFPLPSGRWRIDGAISKDLENKDLLTFKDVGKHFREKSRMNVEISEPDWFSVFHVNERYASSFQLNRCFLVGDAAHIHSPVGAQGMNTGLQDSYNLSWKLAFVLQGKAYTSLINTYSSERIAVAKNVVSGTDLAFTFVTSRNFFAKLFRVHTLPNILQLMLPLLVKRQALLHLFFRRISEIGIHYRKSSLSQHSSTGYFPTYAPLPGERLPYINYQEDGKMINIQDKVKSDYFHLFILSRHSSFDAISRIAERYAHLLSFEIMQYTSGKDDLFNRFGIVDSGCYLVRPDLYIAYRSAKPDADHFETYLQQFFVGK